MGSETSKKATNAAWRKRQRNAIIATFITFFVSIIYYETTIRDLVFNDERKTPRTATDVNSAEIVKEDVITSSVPPKVKQQQQNEIDDSLQNKNKKENNPFVDWRTLEECSQRKYPQTSKPKEDWNQPLWFPSHPASLPDKTYKQLINQLTGLSQGGKSYYASIRNVLRRCQSTQTETATCSVNHPLVEMGGGPDRFKHQFNRKYVMMIRNPKTLFPSYLNNKKVLYHNWKGQVPETDWRQERDTWMDGLMTGWESFLHAWHESRYYEVAMYLPYEHLMDASKGVALIRRLRKVFAEGGYEVASEDEIPCIWFTSMGGKEEFERYETVGYEYHDYEYLPGFTVEQRTKMLLWLSKLMETYNPSVDSELYAILSEYHDDIRDHTRIDDTDTVVGGVNQTT